MGCLSEKGTIQTQDVKPKLYPLATYFTPIRQDFQVLPTDLKLAIYEKNTY